MKKKEYAEQLIDWTTFSEANAACYYNGSFTPGKPGETALQISFFNPRTSRPARAMWYFPVETAYRLRKELDECIKIAEETAKENAKSDVQKLIDDLENEDE